MIIPKIKVDACPSHPYELAPEGWVDAILGDIVDLGVSETKFGEKHFIRFVWFTANRDSHGKLYRVLQQFSVSSHIKSNLMQAIESILDHRVEAPFDTETLIGVRSKIRVKHVLGKDGRKFANIAAYAPSTNEDVEIPSDYVRVFERVKL